MEPSTTTTRRLRVNWDAYARVYDALMALRPYRELMDRAAELVVQMPHMRILDAGSGTGNAAAAIIARTKINGGQSSIFGIDRSREMLEIARAKCAGDAAFGCADFDAALPFPDTTFDAIVCINALYAVRDPAATLAEFARIMRTGGTLVIATPKRGYENGLVLKAHARDTGSDARWREAHASPARERELIAMAFPDDPRIRNAMEAIARHNRAIATDTRFHFFDAEELSTLVMESGFAIEKFENAYADQCHLVRLIRDIGAANGRRS